MNNICSVCDEVLGDKVVRYFGNGDVLCQMCYDWAEILGGRLTVVSRSNDWMLTQQVTKSVMCIRALTTRYRYTI